MGFAKSYRAAMECHDMGSALYEPPFASEIRPGTCGYLDKLGTWQPLFDLTDGMALQLAGMTEPENTGKRMPEKMVETGPDKPLLAQRMRSVQHDFSVDPPLEAAGIPASCSMWWEFEAMADFGAVLICPHPLRKEGFYESTDWEDWARQNARAIIKHKKQVKEHPLWIVTTTYTTKQALINVWEDKDNKVSIGFSVGIDGIADLSPSVAFARSSSGSNWRRLPPKVCMLHPWLSA